MVERPGPEGADGPLQHVKPGLVQRDTPVVFRWHSDGVRGEAVDGASEHWIATTGERTSAPRSDSGIDIPRKLFERFGRGVAPGGEPIESWHARRVVQGGDERSEQGVLIGR